MSQLPSPPGGGGGHPISLGGPGGETGGGGGVTGLDGVGGGTGGAIPLSTGPSKTSDSYSEVIFKGPVTGSARRLFQGTGSFIIYNEDSANAIDVKLQGKMDPNSSMWGDDPATGDGSTIEAGETLILETDVDYSAMRLLAKSTIAGSAANFEAETTVGGG